MISLEEYKTFVKKKFKSDSSADLFSEFDRDGNEVLDFNEFITVHYLYTTKRPYSCSECKEILQGTYFTCVRCFKKVLVTLQICVAVVMVAPIMIIHIRSFSIIALCSETRDTRPSWK